MKNIYLTLLVLTGTILKFEAHGQNTADYQLFLKESAFVPEKNISVELAEISARRAAGGLNGKSFMIIQFENMPDKAETTRLKEAGIELLDYIPNKAFTATVTGVLDVPVLKLVKARSVINLLPEQKMDAGLAQGIFPKHAEKVAGMLDVRVSYPRSFSFEEVSKQLLADGFEILSGEFKSFQIIQLRVSKDRLTELAENSFIQYIEPIAAGVKTLNDRSVINSRANVLTSNAPGGYNLQGQGVVIGVGDDANPMRHIDFSKRVINRAPVKTGSHGLHVAGSIAGGGVIIEKYKGYAPKSTIVAQYFSNILNYAQTYVDDYNMVISNNSYGIEPTVCTDFGGYNMDSYKLDIQASDMSHLTQVFAAGNSGTSTICTNGPANFANILTGFQTGKNIIVVGNTGVDGVIDPNSSKGPLRDGRLKPEIVALGISVNSTFPTDSYTAGSGTSFSTPAVSGGLALLYEKYRSLNKEDPKNALMKALLCNGAIDRGPAGPDYSYGFGWMNLVRSIKMMENNAYLNSEVSNNATNAHTITVPANTGQLKIMLYWNDRASSFFTQKALINDLDLTVTSPDNSVTLPKVLNPSDPSALAVNGVDHVNNIEQVVIDNPAEGNYTVSVKGFAIPENTQQYFVVYDAIPASTTLTYPMGNERMVRNDLAYVSWDSYGNSTSTFKVQYSINNGATWSNINSAVAANLRQISWIVPDFVTTQAKVRVTQNETGVVSESQKFSIFGSPVVTLSTVQCEGYIAVQWPALPKVTDYEIMMFDGIDMVSKGTTTDTKFVLGGLSRDSTYYVSVRARVKDANGVFTVGRRGTAVTRKPNTGDCAGTISDNDLKLDAIVSPANSGRKSTSTEFSSQTQITIRVRNLDDVASGDPVEVGYSINDGAVFSQTISPTIAAGDSYDHAFTLKADMSAINSYKIKVFVNKAGDPVSQNNTLEKTFRQIDNPPLAIPFFDDAENLPKQEISANQMGLIGGDRYDFANSSPIGRLRTFVNSNIAFSGYMAFTLDANRYEAGGNTNYLIGTFNLAAYATKDVRLNFQYKNHGQVSNANNRVWIRGRDIDPWLEVYDLFANQNTPPNGYKLSASIEVNNILRSNGQTLSPSFQVRWGQWGDMITADNADGAGYTIDDINLYTVVNDVQLLSIDSPVSSGCGLGNQEQVNLTIRNSADHQVNNVAVKMQVDQGPVFEKKISIAAGTTLHYTHPQLVDLSLVGAHYMKVWVDLGTDTYAENDALELHFYNSPVISSFPYLQNFEAGTGSWHSEGTNNSWEFGTPSSPKINKAASGTLAWKTKVTGNYNDGELSYLYSPCFAIAGLAHPTLSFSTALDIEDCDDQACDAAYVEYSTDGNTWKLLGAKGSGTNWYDESNNGMDLWSVQDYTRWHVSTTAIPTANTIRFRFVMKSDQAGVREGIAIDDIHVYDLNNGVYTSGPVSSTITQNSVNGGNWINFTEGDKIIASIMPNNQDLGSTDLKSYRNEGNVRNSNGQYYLDRNFTIKPSNKNLNDFVTVRLYFPDSEAENLINASGCPTCEKLNTAYDLAITKFSSSVSSSEDGDVANNSNGNWLLYPSLDVLKVPYDNGYYAEFKTKTFSEFWLAKDFIATGSALPVELISFTAKKRAGADAEDVLLEWSTASEKNFDHFDIEVALGEEHVRQGIFAKIGEMEGSGDSRAELKYTFTDHEITEGLTRYYRLKMVDTDESFSYSNLRSVTFSTRDAWRIFPNPSAGIFNLEFKSEKEKPVTMRIYDLSGRLIEKTAIAPTGSLQKQKIDMSSSGFEPGVYMLEVASGEDKQVFKLMRD